MNEWFRERSPGKPDCTCRGSDVSGESARDRFRSVLGFERTGAGFFWECVGFPSQTIARWHNEGLPAEITASSQWSRPLYDYFGLDWVNFAPISSGPLPRMPEVRVAFDGEQEIVRTSDGALVRRRPGRDWQEYIEYPVRDEATYEALLPRLDPATPERWHEWCDGGRTWTASAVKDDSPVALFLIGPFARVRQFMGNEGFFVALYEQPELVQRILADHSDFCCSIARACADHVSVHFCYLWEDMSYKGGMLISPEMFRDFIRPAARRIIEELKALGIDIVIVDSDGNVRELIPLYVECGTTGFLPFEVRAGMDVREVRSAHPHLQILGGIDKTLVAEGGRALEEEVRRKVPAMLDTGGYIPCLDHQPHPQISLEDYRRYVELVKGLLARRA